MFLDEKRQGEAPTKTDPLSLSSLISWLERQLADETYDYTECDDCVLFRYFKAMGVECFSVGPSFYRTPDYEQHELPYGFEDIAFGDGSSAGHSMGAALERARKIAASNVSD